MARAFLVVALCAGAAGCYVEGSAGFYSVDGAANATRDWAWSMGIASGVFLDPGEVRAAVGAGGELLVIEQEAEDAPKAQQEHRALGLHARFDVRLFKIDRRGDHMNLTLSYAVRWWDSIEIDYGDTDIEIDGVTHSVFLGPTAYFRFGTEFIGGIGISLGPALFRTSTDGEYGLTALGGQLRITSGNYPDLSNIAAFTAVMMRPTPRDAVRSGQIQEHYWRGQGFAPCSELPSNHPDCD